MNVSVPKCGPVGRGLDAYRTAIAHNYAAMELQSGLPSESYVWSVEGRHCGGVGLTRIFAGGPVHARITREPTSDEARSIILAFVEDGAFEIEQGHRYASCPADTLVLMNATQPLEVRQVGTASLFSLIIPADFLRLRIPHIDVACTTARRADNGAAAVLRDLLQSSWREREFFDRDDAKMLAGTFASLIGSVFVRAEKTAFDAGATSIKREQIESIIEAELEDPQLSPSLIAERLGISASYLFALAHRLNFRLRQQIINRRLEVCRDALADPAWSRRTITEIAYNWGFQDAAHFSRRFSQRFGLTPKAYRESTASALAPVGTGIQGPRR